MRIKEILKSLGIPDKKLNRKVKIAKGEIFITRGTSQDGYHGFRADYTVYDPHKQLVVESKDSSDQYVWSDKTLFSYKGEKPAAVTYSYTDVATSTYDFGIYLFLPPDFEVNLKAERLDEVEYQPPPNLIRRWIKEVSTKEKRPPQLWRNYARVVEKVLHKALVYAAYRFAREYPDRVGLIHDIWGGYSKDGGNLEYHGTSVLIRNGIVEFVNSRYTTLGVLASKYGIEKFHPISIKDVEINV